MVGPPLLTENRIDRVAPQLVSIHCFCLVGSCCVDWKKWRESHDKFAKLSGLLAERRQTESVSCYRMLVYLTSISLNRWTA